MDREVGEVNKFKFLYPEMSNKDWIVQSVFGRLRDTFDARMIESQLVLRETDG